MDQPQSHQRSLRTLLALLAFIVILRAGTLGLVDLIDPTESRYAFVAQEMVLSGDWVTPRLPLPTGLEAYTGKPPLHFWQTAVAMTILGMDAWVTRLPSFFAWLLIGFCTYFFSLSLLSKENSIVATLITLSTGLLFFLAGSSTLDVTFSAWISGALCSFAICAQNRSPTSQKLTGYAFFVFTALAFLTKGPAACVLIGLPIALWLLWRDARTNFPKLPWITGSLLFFAVASPWFFLAQRTNPEFMHYFFVQENFLRFISKDYGDKFGTGHVYPRGSAVWMLLMGFLPWTLVFVPLFIGSKETRNSLRTLSLWARFALCWGLAPALFFSLARQLHPAYLLPGFSGLAVFLMLLIQQTNFRIEYYLGLLKRALFLLALGSIPVSLFFRAGITQVLLACAVISIAFLLQKRMLKESDPKSCASLALNSILLLVCVIILFSSHASHIKSARTVLSNLAADGNTLKQQTRFLSKNSYSFYYYPRDWQHQLGAPVKAGYSELEDIITTPPHNLILNKSDIERLPASLAILYQERGDYGKWKWWQLKELS